jgi:acyl-CoA thioesterase YciA
MSSSFPPDIIPTLRVVAMPMDTNPAGDVFGGWLISQMDLAAGTTAAFRARGRCVTVAIDSFTFHEPVVVGDEVSIYTKIIRIGRTSITVHVETWRRARNTTDRYKVTQGKFTFVALDDRRQPRPLPPEDGFNTLAEWDQDSLAGLPNNAVPRKSLSGNGGSGQKFSKPSGDLTVRVIAMPNNINAAGDVFGGWVMSQMDLAGGSMMSMRSCTKTVTVAIDRVSFLAPMMVGDELSVYTEIVKIGRTSATIAVQAWRRPQRQRCLQLVTHGTFVFVALDDNNRPTPIPAFQQ